MNIRTKSIVVFSVIVLLIWAIVFHVLFTYTSMLEEFKVIKGDTIPGVVAAVEMEEQVQEIRAWTFVYMLQGNIIRMDIPAKEWLQENMRSLEKLAQEHREAQIGLEDQKFSEQIENNVKQLNYAVTEIVNLKDQGAEVDELMEKRTEAFTPISSLLTEQLEVHKAAHLEQLVESEEAVHETHTSGMEVLLLAAGLITLLIIAVRFFAVRSIANPLQALHRGTEIIGQGNFDYKVGTKAKDEIGQLSRAFDQMTENLRTSTTSIDNLNKEIIERKQAEEALVDEATRRRILIEQSRDGIVVLDQDGGVYESNQRFAEMLGYSSEEILQLHVWDWEFQFTREQLLDMLLSVDEAGDNFETQHRRKDGTIYDVEISTNGAVFAGQKLIFCVCRDISERKRVEDRLRESEEKSRVFMETASDLMNITDKDGKITYVNDSMARTLGYSKEELIGMHITQLLSKESLEKDFKPNWGKFLTNGKISLEATFLTKEGKEIYCEMKAVAVYDGDGNYAGGRAVHRDITERKRMEQELVEDGRKLEQASQAKSEFLASMSHELRTPLNAVIGFSEIMLDGVAGEISDEQRDYLTDILESGEHLLKLINDVLDLSKVEAGKMELRVESLNLADIVTETSQTVSTLLDDKKLELRVNLQEGLPSVSADRTRLKQVFLNLLSNAIKFTPSGGEIAIEGSSKDEWCYVSVVDNGIGISKEDQERIFQPFVQGKTPPEQAKEGTGLGLTLSREFIEACGGRIWVESEYGKGSRFTFTLPLTKESESHQEIQRKKPAEVIHRLRKIPLKPGQKTILVVDDDRKSRTLMEAWLREEGYAVVQASSGDEGIRQAKELMPAAIILDLLMPDKDGWQVLQELKSTPKTRDIPVIVASVTEEKELCFSLGAVDYFAKPVNKRRFLGKMANLGVTRGKEVLVVDDNPADVRLVASILEAENIKVLRAYGGYEGLKIAKEHKPALIVLDLVMPDCCGFEVIERLHGEEGTRHIPVVVFTVKDLTEDELNMLSSHVAAIVRKAAFKREDFLSEVRKAANMG